MPDTGDLSQYSDQELLDLYTDYLVLHQEYIDQGDSIPDWLYKVRVDVAEELEHRGLD